MKPNKKAQDMTVAELAAYIDQSVLKPEFTQAEIRRYIQEGIDFGCKTVCINPASRSPTPCAGVRKPNFAWSATFPSGCLPRNRKSCKPISTAKKAIFSSWIWSLIMAGSAAVCGVRWKRISKQSRTFVINTGRLLKSYSKRMR